MTLHTLHRVVLVSIIAGCGKDPEQRTAVPATVPLDAQSIDAAATIRIDAPFALPSVRAVAALPAAPAAYVFVTARGTMHVGATPVFAAATEVGDVTSLRKLIPPDPNAPAPIDAPDGGWGTIGTGTYGTLGPGNPHGQGYGIGYGPGGSHIAQRFTSSRTAATAARVVLIADRQAPIMTIGRLVIGDHEPYAIAAVDATGAQGVLPLGLIGGLGATAPDNAVELFTHSTFADLVSWLDATPAAMPAVTVSVRGASSGMRSRGSASIPQVRIGQPSTVGDLDKALIRRYIKRNIQKITYCYEKRLLAKPGLEGTLVAKFVIKEDGTVPSSQASGVDREVDKCVADVIHTIQFPEPKGGIVQVQYPFTFRPAGE